MKKILFSTIILSMLFQPVFAAIQQTTSGVEIGSEMLKENFDAYTLSFTNLGNNPVKIANIDISGMVTNANQVLVSEGLKAVKKNNKYAYMGILTLGITTLVGTAKNNTIINKQKVALAEAATFNSNFETAKSEIIMPNSTKTFRILVQKNQEPNISAIFQDTKTNEYIKAVK